MELRATPIVVAVFQGRMVRFREVMVATAIAVAVMCAPVNAKTVAQEDSAVGISAARGMAVWSTLDPFEDRYRMRLYANGVVRTLPIRPRLVPFDVDLGIDRSGHTVAVYSRCKTEGTRSTEFSASSPDWSLASGCKLYELRIAGGREHRLRGPGAAYQDDFMPSLDGDRIAFARRNENAVGIDQAPPHLRLYNFRTHKTIALPEGTRGDYGSFGRLDDGRADWWGGPGPTGLDLRGDALAVTWGYQQECNPGSKLGDDYATLQELWVMRTSGSKTLVEGSDCSHEAQVSEPVLTPSAILYLSGPRSTLTRLVRRSRETSTGVQNLDSIGGNENALFAIQYGNPGKVRVLRLADAFRAMQP